MFYVANSFPGAELRLNEDLEVRNNPPHSWALVKQLLQTTSEQTSNVIGKFSLFFFSFLRLVGRVPFPRVGMFVSSPFLLFPPSKTSGWKPAEGTDNPAHAEISWNYTNKQKVEQGCKAGTIAQCNYRNAVWGLF